MNYQPLKLLLILPWFSVALAEGTTTLQGPIAIEADRMEMNQRQGTSHYRGNVLLKQGELLIKADSITLHTKGKELQRVEISGSPATLRQHSDNADQAIRAEARQMDYHPQQGWIEFRGAAQLWRQGNEFSGESIRYNLRQRMVKASGGTEGEERVRVLLQPATADKQQEPKP
ncbi:MAG: lipopolysaccharide transport periplasmic protein LptA [Chromatiales bacterium]|nr:lipopolysaccharide transport periplasmic protein LptA [Chromatiales bacterium]